MVGVNSGRRPARGRSVEMNGMQPIKRFGTFPMIPRGQGFRAAVEMIQIQWCWRFRRFLSVFRVASLWEAFDAGRFQWNALAARLSSIPWGQGMRWPLQAIHARCIAPMRRLAWNRWAQGLRGNIRAVREQLVTRIRGLRSIPRRQGWRFIPEKFRIARIMAFRYFPLNLRGQGVHAVIMTSVIIATAGLAFVAALTDFSGSDSQKPDAPTLALMHRVAQATRSVPVAAATRSDPVGAASDGLPIVAEPIALPPGAGAPEPSRAPETAIDEQTESGPSSAVELPNSAANPRETMVNLGQPDSVEFENNYEKIYENIFENIARGLHKPNHPPPVPEPKLREPGRLAIVIDDLGHNLRMPRHFLSLGLPLTYSILPDRPYTAEVVELIRAAGQDFLLHLPMEPLAYPRVDPGGQALLLSLDTATLHARLERHLNHLTGAIGVNNHMGSAFTYDAGKMAVVMEAVARRGLFFLNSKTSESPVPAALAKERGYRYLERDVFLDHVVEEGAIRAALERALYQARVTGIAIAIGHPHPETLRVLRKRLTGISKDHVRLVSLAEL